MCQCGVVLVRVEMYQCGVVLVRVEMFQCGALPLVYGAMTQAAQLHWCHTGCVCLCGSGVCGMG